MIAMFVLLVVAWGRNRSNVPLAADTCCEEQSNQRFIFVTCLQDLQHLCALKWKLKVSTNPRNPMDLDMSALNFVKNGNYSVNC